MTKLENRVAIITENNFNELSKLYGAMDGDRLSQVVNNHIAVAIAEIKEDILKSNTY